MYWASSHLSSAGRPTQHGCRGLASMPNTPSCFLARGLCHGRAVEDKPGSDLRCYPSRWMLNQRLQYSHFASPLGETSACSPRSEPQFGQL